MESSTKTNSLTNAFKHGFGKEEMPSKPKKSLMSAIILKNCRQTIKDSFVKPSHKNKGKVKLVSITSLVTKCRI